MIVSCRDNSLGGETLTAHNTNTPAAEHAFELHMIKDFFIWLFIEGYLDCPALQKVFGDDSSGQNNAQSMIDQLAWYDPVSGQGFIDELFVLNRGLNHLKGAVSFSFLFALYLPLDTVLTNLLGLLNIHIDYAW
jgi:hypothetical protein